MPTTDLATEAVRIHTTHQALADELRSMREMVSRLLKGLAEQGLVTLGREQITLSNKTALAQLADNHR